MKSISELSQDSSLLQEQTFENSPLDLPPIMVEVLEDTNLPPIMAVAFEPEETNLQALL